MHLAPLLFPTVWMLEAVFDLMVLSSTHLTALDFVSHEHKHNLSGSPNIRVFCLIPLLTSFIFE